MNEKLQLLIGRRVMVSQTFSNGADLTICGKLKTRNDGRYFVTPELAAVLLGFAAESVSTIDPGQGEPWIYLKAI